MTYINQPAINDRLGSLATATHYTPNGRYSSDLLLA